MELGVRYKGRVSNQRVIVECLTCNSGMSFEITYDDYIFLDLQRQKYMKRHSIKAHGFPEGEE